MLMETERELIVEYGKKLIERGLTRGTGGNLSIFDRKNRIMAITPSGMDYYDIKPKNIAILSIDGKQLEGDKKPSSEIEMHRIFYKRRNDINAIIHAHTVYATTLSCLNWSLPPVHYMVALAGDDVKCSKYATFGTKELAENAYEAMKNRKAVLLANHGLLAGADDLPNAFNIIEEIEYCSELYYRAKSIGDPIILSDDEMNIMKEKFKTYGKK